MKKIYIILGIALLILCAAGYRHTQTILCTIGTGEEAQSPDGRYTARITAYHGERFWGDETKWYEFELKDSNGEQIRFWKTDTIPLAHFGSRTETNVVTWLENSSAVWFSLPGIEIKMEPQQPGPPYAPQAARR
jgi:hypothetical protein